jgi:dethiobiotin synthetase
MPAPTQRRARERLRGILVAGTDTGVGKTIVSCGLLRLASDRGWPLLPFKPAESGCLGGHPADADALRAAARRLDLPLDSVCPFPFVPAVAPAAAHGAGRALTRSRICTAAKNLARTQTPAPPLLVESAGGLLSPYAPTWTTADLAKSFGLPVLLIARHGLGTINHTALAIHELRRRRLPLLGLLLVTTRREPGLSQQRNPELIESLTGVRPDAVIPYFARPTPARIAAHLDATGVGARLLRKAGLA